MIDVNEVLKDFINTYNETLDLPSNIKRCPTNPDDAISRAYRQGEEQVFNHYTSDTSYNDFTLFYNYD